MGLFLKDISSINCNCSFNSAYNGELELFFGSAICLDFSDVHHTDIIDLSKLKKSISKNKHSVRSGDIVLIYTGHSDRFFGTSYWKKRRTIMTHSAIEHLSNLGVKNLGIDAPFMIDGLDLNYSNMALTFSLSNIGHLVNERFIYMGFPVISIKSNKYILRASVLI